MKLDIFLGAPTIQKQLEKAGIKIYDKNLIKQFDKHFENLDWLYGFDVITRNEYHRIKTRIAKLLNKHLAQFY